MEASPKENRYGLRGGAVGSRMLLVQPDAVLCTLCARGSDDAFDVLHARYRQQVFAFVFHLLNHRNAVDDAEDITQEVFGKAFSCIRTKSADGSFKHWLFAIARNTTFDHIRARKPQGVPLDDATEERTEQANTVSIASQVERKAELAWLVTAVAELPERQREALVMRELGGMSHAEIAEQLGTSVDAIKQLIKRGRANVGESAERSGYRSRNLGRELAMAAPVAPLAAAGLGLTATGAGAAVGLGGLAMGSKVAATVLAVVAIGGGAAVIEQVETGPARSADANNAAQRSAPAGAVEPEDGAALALGGAAQVDSASADERRAERAARKSERERRAQDKKRAGGSAGNGKSRGEGKSKGRAAGNDNGHGGSNGQTASSDRSAGGSGGGSESGGSGNSSGGRPSAGSGGGNSPSGAGEAGPAGGGGDGAGARGGGPKK